MKPRVLIVVDVPGWALERTADNVIMRLSDRYHFEKVYRDNAAERIRSGGFDLLYVTYETLFQDAKIDVALPRRAVTGVRSHFKWDGGGKGLPPSPEFVNHLNRFIAVHAPSKILCNIFGKLHPAVFHTPHGVDVDVFTPRPEGPVATPSGELCLGWAGSLTNHPGKRGVEDFIVPVVEDLPGVRLRLAAREQRWRTQAEMVEFYRGLDTLICASRTEGGPHPLLEASACGIPVISTRVGIAPELIDHGLNGFLIDRTVEAIRETVLGLRDDRELRLEMGRQARRAVEEAWNWDVQAPIYVPFFERGLENSG